MSEEFSEIRDYDEVRKVVASTMFVVDSLDSLLVLGSHQRPPQHTRWPLRRRRGGGGMVLVRPGDVWVDWWIPRSAQHWIDDIRAHAVLVGEWWQEALRSIGIESSVHRDGVRSDVDGVCFGGVGPGELLVDDRKAVGLTQWRVREGALLSTLLPIDDSVDLMGSVATLSEGTRDTLSHHSQRSLQIGPAEREALVRELTFRSESHDVFFTRII